MKNFFQDKKKMAKFFAVFTVVGLFILGGTAGATSSYMQGFFRTLGSLVSNTVENPNTFEYGYGYSDSSYDYGYSYNADGTYGYGYGYGFGFDGTCTEIDNASTYDTSCNVVTCNDGYDLNGDVCTRRSSGGGGGGGGMVKDDCPNGDFSPSYYDKVCGVVTGGTGTGSTGGSFTGTGDLFSDIANSFARNDINLLAKQGIFKGYNDGTFKPNNPITRAEFLGVVMKSLGINLSSTGVNLFTDVVTPWMIPYVIKAKELGIANGQIIDGKLKFRPNDNITRAEAIAVLLNAAKIAVNLKITTTTFTDVIIPWMIPYANKAKELGIANGQIINGKLVFRPNDPISRAETAKVIMKTLTYLESIKK